MNQDIIHTSETISSLESICKRYEVNMMEELTSVSDQPYPFNPLVSNLIKAVEAFENLKQKAQQNVAAAQRGLGFCYEQGLSDDWFQIVKKFIEIDTLFRQRIEECSDLQVLLKEREKKRTNIKDKCHGLIMSQADEFSSSGSSYVLTSDKPETVVFRASKSNSSKKRGLDYLNPILIEELEPLALEIDDLSKRIEPLKHSLISDELHESLKSCEFIIFSKNTYKSKVTVVPELAFKWYEKAVLNGDKYACADLGFCYLRGFGIAVDKQKAISLLIEAAEAGNCMALNLLGDCYANGIVLDEDMCKAQDCWNKASVCKDQSITEIYFLLKHLFIDDGFNEDAYLESQNKDYLEYKDWLEEIVNFYLKNGCFSELVDKNSIYWNDVIDKTSLSNEKSDLADEVLHDNKVKYKKYKADTSDIKVWLALFSAGSSYLGISAESEFGMSTQGIEKNQSKALEIWHSLAENDNPVACFRLGMHYFSLDIDKSLVHLTKSAKQNFYPANLALALFYFNNSESKFNLDLSLLHIEKVIGSNEILARIAKPNSPFSEIYDKFDDYVFGDYSWEIIEYIRLCGLLLIKKHADGLERSQKIISNIVDYSISNAIWLNKDSLGEKDALEKARQIFVDDPVMLLLCEFAFDHHSKLKSEKWLMNFMKSQEYLAPKIKHQKIKYRKNTLDNVIESFVMDLTGPATGKFSLIYQNDTVFNGLIKWIYQEHYDPLLLGLLNFYKAYDFRNYKYDKSSQNIEFALSWLQASDILLTRVRNYYSDLDTQEIMLSGYCQALANEVCNPKIALQILTSFPSNSQIFTIRLRSEKDAQATLTGRIKFKCFELQARVELRIKAAEAERYAEWAEAEAARANDLKNRLEKLVQRTSHTLANTIFPNTLYQVAEHIKDKSEHRHDALLLLDAYHAEVSIRHENELLQQRYTTDNPEPLRQIMRGDRRPLPDDGARSIEQLIDYALSRVLSRLLNTQSPKLDAVRRKILGNHADSIDGLRMDFDDAMFFRKPPMTALAWCSQYVRPVELIYRQSLWQEIGLKREGLAEALLYGHFAELLLNAFKYADHSQADFLRLELDKATHNGQDYLTMTFSNPVTATGATGLGSHQGLEAVKEDFSQLNGAIENAPTLTQWQDNGRFYVQISYQADLLWSKPRITIDVARMLLDD